MSTVWFERDAEGQRWIVRIPGRPDAFFDSEIAARSHAEDHVHGPSDLTDLLNAEYPEIDLDSELTIQDPGVIKMKPAKIIDMNTKNRRKPKE
jgi:hypothetical protein